MGRGDAVRELYSMGRGVDRHEAWGMEHGVGRVKRSDGECQ